jgi:5-methyltetrahydropteroyltriglutamate--homocysteine methyltransferase
MGSGSYEHVAETIFNSLDVDASFLEYDSERAGGFEPLRFIPKDKLVVLGLISTKTPLMESRSALCRQIEAAAAFVPLERLCLSPQCEFASADLGTELTESDQIAKLQLVVDTATEIWDEPA